MRLRTYTQRKDSCLGRWNNMPLSTTRPMLKWMKLNVFSDFSSHFSWNEMNRKFVNTVIRIFFSKFARIESIILSKCRQTSMSCTVLDDCQSLLMSVAGGLPIALNTETGTNIAKVLFCSYLCVLCRQYGPLTEDLIAVLLQADPGARPTAAQVLAIPAVRPYAEAYVRRMRAVAERCVSPLTPLSPPPAEQHSHQRDTRTGNDVTPEPEVDGSGDGAACAKEPENDQKRWFWADFRWCTIVSFWVR